MELQSWYASGSYFKYKDRYRIFYREEANQKDVLLLLHGFPTSSWDWSKLWHHLKANYHLIAPDFIGFGFSDKPKIYSYSIQDQADLVETFLEEKEFAKVQVLSHDYGDTVMQELLARHMERKANNLKGIVYNSVCMLNGGILPKYHKARPIQKGLISPFGILLTPFLNKKKLKRNFDAIFGKQAKPTSEEIDSFYAQIKYNKGKYIFHKLIRYMTERKQYEDRWVNALKNSPVPLGLINGNEDPVSGKHVSDAIRSVAPNVEVIDLTTIGHYPQMEAPELVLQAFSDFNK